MGDSQLPQTCQLHRGIEHHYALLTVQWYCVLHTAHCTVLTAHCSLLTAHLLTAHCARLTAHLDEHVQRIHRSAHRWCKLQLSVHIHPLPVHQCPQLHTYPCISPTVPTSSKTSWCGRYLEIRLGTRVSAIVKHIQLYGREPPSVERCAALQVVGLCEFIVGAEDVLHNAEIHFSRVELPYNYS